MIIKLLSSFLQISFCTSDLQKDQRQVSFGPHDEAPWKPGSEAHLEPTTSIYEPSAPQTDGHGQRSKKNRRRNQSDVGSTHGPISCARPELSSQLHLHLLDGVSWVRLQLQPQNEQPGGKV